MLKAFSILLCVLMLQKAFAQDSTALINEGRASKTLAAKPRLKFVIGGNTVAYGGTTIALYNTWYKDYPQSRFHFFNDNKEWLQVDKVGHAYSAYTEGRAGIEMWKWAGLPNKQSIWIGGLTGIFYQSVIEVLDGFSSEWGFSWGDYAANVLGSSMLISQQLMWNEQRVSFKFSFHRKDYGNAFLNARANDIYGKSFAERMLKDYNGQTYWLSINPKSFFKDSNFPTWLNLAVGYGADGMFGAVNNKWTSQSGQAYDLASIKRYRQFYLAPDIDFTRIKTKSKLLHTAFFVLNSFKFPAPSIEFSNGKIASHWLHF
jgi:hypothetical protein